MKCAYISIPNKGKLLKFTYLREKRGLVMHIFRTEVYVLLIVDVQRFRRQNSFEVNQTNLNTIKSFEYIIKSDVTITDKEAFQNNNNFIL